MTRLRMLTALVAVTALWAPPARAAVGVSPTADTTWSTEIADTGKAGRVLTVAVSGGLVYLGGDFAALSPPGSKDSSALVRRDHLAALDAATGRLIPWLPPKDAGGRYYGHTGTPDKSRPGGVYAITPSADGTTVHVGGTFLSFGGHSGLISLDAATGQPTPWQAKVDR